ncbi:phenolic acid decarboxylase [Streptomyces sp. NPDC097107]|uniref:phenolic acid decarboxylase n=1 Tax=Streptomyces sp. NPDC097107 TaxID=3366089 RepID=UPI003818B379
MTAVYPVQDLSFLLGLHVIYEYDGGIAADLYVRNEHSVDYRVLKGPVAGRWVTRQKASVASLGGGTGILSWAERTGSTVSMVIDPVGRWLYGSAFFAKWVDENPGTTLGHQSDHLEGIRKLRNEGPVAPHSPLHQFAEITFLEVCSTDNDEVISCSPGELPAGFAGLRN